MSTNTYVPRRKPMVTYQKDFLVCETYPTGKLGCNTSFLYDSRSLETLLIDPGNDPDWIVQFIKDRKFLIKEVVHTHAHFDHIGSTAKLILSLQWKAWLHKQDLFLYEGLPQQGLFFGEHFASPPPLQHFLEHEQTFTLENYTNPTLTALHSPGHTPGSCCFLTHGFLAPILFTGDTLFQRSIGRTDLPGGDSQQIISSIKTLYNLLEDETICIPGHGPITSIQEEKKSNPFVSGR